MIRLTSRQQLGGLLVLACFVRLATFSLYPLTDTTEARYGEIARKMLETGDWIVPQIDYDVPFWGKPPLSFWLTAFSFKLFGVTEFAARLPSLLLAVAVCALVHKVGSDRNGVDNGLRASTVVATSLLMMVSAGGVMTDPAMMLGTTLSMVAFWSAFKTGSRAWGYLFFVGLAIGLLSKGPVAIVLTLAPISVWAIMMGQVRGTWRHVPWLVGTLVTAALVLPWYWAAELQSPGFLRYFLIGEHWDRFTVSGWRGDLYGSGHARPRGTIWLYALLGAVPWSVWLLWQFATGRAVAALTSVRSDDGWLVYLSCWIFAPLVLFTMAANILPTYVLPGLAGFGLLVAEVWGHREPAKRIKMLGLVTPALLMVIVLVVWPYSGFQSQKEIVSAYRESLESEIPLFYFNRRAYSADFYTRGNARQINDVAQLRKNLDATTPTYIAIEQADIEHLPADLRERLSKIVTSRSGKYVLFREERVEPLSDSH